MAALKEWPAFVWVLAHGRGGWVPARHLDLNPDGAGTALRDYDTTELTVSSRELLQVVENDTESGWLWGRATDGREGWVPWNAVEHLSAATE